MNKSPIIILDISSISNIKDAMRIKLGSDERKKQRLSELEQYANGDYRFSLLLSIWEKATDYKNVMNEEQLQERFEKDFTQIISFLGEENMNESIPMLIKYLMDDGYSKEERAELSIPHKLKLLNFYNEKSIVNTPPKKERFDLAENIVSKALDLGLTTGEPVVLTCISSIFGCEDARDLLKIKMDKTKFNASNALGDIMSLQRVAKIKSLLEMHHADTEIIYRTEDEALENFHKYIEVTVIGEKVVCKLLSPAKLFPVFYKGDDCIEPDLQSKLYKLLGYTVS